MHEIEIDPALSEKDKARQRAELEETFADRSERIHNISQLLTAYSLYEKDVEYVVSDGRVIIVDEFTGRLMPGRRYADGLHQAIEAKEVVKVEVETQTLATITLQNYFRLYEKLAGMTGTAETEAAELWEIYKLDVVVIPTNEPVRRLDYDDVIYRTRNEKYNSVLREIEELCRNKRPVLVGTISVDVSETLSRMLKRRGIPHSVLNARYHQQEAEIIARAGQPGAVTIATNMAGRGTDIKLGPGVVSCDKCCINCSDDCSLCHKSAKMTECLSETPCGLQIVGTERHEARRIDRQLRGRSGRQGDPGSSRFYLSLEDDLMRLFGSERIAGVLDRLGVGEGEAIQHRMVTNAIGRSQRKVEAHNFDIRKHLLEYDDVMNQQREVIYARRLRALEGEDLRDDIMEICDAFIDRKVSAYCDSKAYPEEWDLTALKTDLMRTLRLNFSTDGDAPPEMKPEALADKIKEMAREAYRRREEEIDPELMRQLERIATLQVIDERWRDHLYEMDHLKGGVGLRAYGQKDPLIEYKQEGFQMFVEMLDRIDEEVLTLLFNARLAKEPPVRRARVRARMREFHQSAMGMGFQARNQSEEAPGKPEPVRAGPKIGRNAPCPCGSGKKYKKCCGR